MPQIHLIPLAELSPGQAASIRNEVIDAVVKIASTELKLPADKLVVRDIRPKTDLGYANEDYKEVTGSTTGVFETMCSGTMADQRWVAIYGVRDDSPSPSVTQLKFTIGGSDRVIWDIQGLYGVNETKVGLSPSPVIIPQNIPFTIQRYVIAAQLGAHIILKGVTVEPVGKTLTP